MWEKGDASWSLVNNIYVLRNTFFAIVMIMVILLKG